MSKIEWTEKTWNPIAGCSVLSPGCTNCYAMKMARRLELMGSATYAGLTQPSKAGPVWTGKIEVNENAMSEPLRRRKPTMYFVNSMSDLFHESVPDEVIDRVFAVMALCPQHTFQVLTKRSARMREYLARLTNEGGTRWAADILSDAAYDLVGEDGANALANVLNGFSWWRFMPPREGKLDGSAPLWPLPNVWLGVSVEDQKRADERRDDLEATPAAIRFLSIEPMLGPIDLSSWLVCPNAVDGLSMDPSTGAYECCTNCDWTGIRSSIDWVIIGGESGPGARPMRREWAQSIVNQCQDAGVAVFVKQLSSGGPKAIKDIEQFPEGLRVREWPRS